MNILTTRMRTQSTSASTPISRWCGWTAFCRQSSAGLVALAAVLPYAGAQQGLVGSYQFESGTPGQVATTVFDSSPFGINGTATGGPIYSADVNYAALCATSAVSLQLNDAAGGNRAVWFNSAHPITAPGDFTTSFWFKSPCSAHGAIIWAGSSDPGQDTTNFFQIFVNTDATVGFNYRSPSGEAHCLGYACGPSGGYSVVRNQWTHMAVVRQGNTYRAYFNGTLIDTATDPNPSLPNAAAWGIGARPGYPFIGLIDDLRLYSRAISQQEIVQIFAPPVSPPRILSTSFAGYACTEDTTASWTVNVDPNSTPPFRYEWRKDNVVLTNDGHYSGATTGQLRVNSTRLSDNGNYRCIVSNCAGSDDSQQYFSVEEHAAIRFNPVDVTACVGATATFSVSATGALPLSYQWQHDGVDIPGATGRALSISPVTPQSAGAYTCWASNNCSSRRSSAATLTIGCCGPSITAQPSPVAVCIAGAATFNVVADSAEPLSYQWIRGGTLLSDVAGRITGATTPTLRILNVQEADSSDAALGPYACIVSNGCAGVNTIPADLSVLHTIACVKAAPVGTLTYLTDVRVVSTTDMTESPSSIQVHLEDSTGALALYDPFGARMTYILSDIARPNGVNNVFSYLEVRSNMFNGLFEVSPVDRSYQNWFGAFRHEDPALTQVVAADFAAQSPTAEALESRLVRLNDFVFSQSGPFVGATDYLNGGVRARIQTTAIAAQFNAAYGNIPTGRRVQLTGIFSQFDTTPPFDSGYELLPISMVICPAIATQPSDVTACAAGDASFTTTALGTGPFTYVWRANGVPIPVNGPDANPSAATATLSLTNLLPSSVGSFDCIVTNSCGSVESSSAQLIICIGEYNCDGGTDGADIGAFFDDWGAGNAAADVNADGGIDGSDVSVFFEHWEIGC